MGKKQLGELQPSELVTTILISNLASIPIESPEIPLLSSVIPVFVIVCLEVLLSGVCAAWRPAAQLISGSPKVVIKNGELDQQVLKELRFTADDVLEALRGKDIFSTSDVALGIVETNGTLNVYKKFEANTPTNADMKIQNSGGVLPVLPVVVDGYPEEDNIRLIGINKQQINSILQKNNCQEKEVLLLLCDGTENYKLIKKENGRKRVRSQRGAV